MLAPYNRGKIYEPRHLIEWGSYIESAYWTYWGNILLIRYMGYSGVSEEHKLIKGRTEDIIKVLHFQILQNHLTCLPNTGTLIRLFTMFWSVCRGLCLCAYRQELHKLVTRIYAKSRKGNLNCLKIIQIRNVKEILKKKYQKIRNYLFHTYNSNTSRAFVSVILLKDVLRNFFIVEINHLRTVSLYFVNTFFWMRNYNLHELCTLY